MKLSFNWLQQFFEKKLPRPEKLGEKLTLAGFELEKIVYSPEIKGVVVGEIRRIRKHPKIKKLKIVETVIKKQGNKVIKRQIISGAPNIKIGQKVVVALAGAQLVGLDIDGKPGKEPLMIFEREIKGIKSEGVLCAEDEIGLSNDHSGVYILSPETKIGEEINKVLDLKDAVLEFEITPNRKDCLSVFGLAREVAAITDLRFKMPKDPFQTFNFSKYYNQYKNFKETKIQEAFSGKDLIVEVKDPKLCPKYTAQIIKNIKVNESPQWLKNRLRKHGIKSINSIVDVTNYVMIELGQPLHAFDFRKIKKSEKATPSIIVRKAKKGERIVTIDGKKRELDETMLVIANAKKPIAVAGVMGGKESEISKETKDIVLESAQFDPLSIRKTALKLGLQTESSYRFERGIDWNMIEIALDRATELIIKLQPKGQKAKRGEKIILQQQTRYLRRTIKLPMRKIEKFLGIKLNKSRVKSILESLGFKIAEFEILKPQLLDLEKSKETIVKEAEKLLGRPYKYGVLESEAPKRFDCSSLTQYLYKKIGIIIPRCSIDQAFCGFIIEPKDHEALKKVLKPGDLIFIKKENPHYSLEFPEGIEHLGIYVGGDKLVHASLEKRKVTKDNLEIFFKEGKCQVIRRILDSKIFKEDLHFIITVPSWREDVSLPEDLIEEIGRIYDYNKLKPTALKGEIPFSELNKEMILENFIKDILVGIGMVEIYNYSFYDKKQIELAGDKGLSKRHFQIANPINPFQEFLRISIIPGLLEVARKNARNFKEVKIFELGKIYLKKEDQIDEKKVIAGMALSQTSSPDSQIYLKEVFYQIKGVLELLFDKLNIKKDKIDYRSLSDFKLTPSLDFASSLLDKQKSALIEINGEIVGLLGEINSLLREKYEFLNATIFELDFQKLIKNFRKKKYRPISYYPSLVRDLAIVVEKEIPSAVLAKTIKEIDPLIKEIELFDFFENEKKLGKNKKSLAFHLVFQAFDRTLKAGEVDFIFQKILEKLKEEFSAQIREG